MADLVWLHEDALRRMHPVFVAADYERGNDTQPVFIWDVDYFGENDIGLKRQHFIYETLVEMGAEIHAGSMHDILPRLVAARSVTRVLVPATPNPNMLRRYGQVRRALSDIAFDMVDDTPFATLSKPADLGRFFRYWNKARKSAMRPHGG